MTEQSEPAEPDPCVPASMSPAELRTLFLFESLTDEQLRWIADHSCLRHVPAGDMVFVEGEPAAEFFMLLAGTLALSRRVGQDDVETVRTSQRGVYMGATQAYVLKEAAVADGSRR